MFNVQINNKLKDLMGSKKEFGGISIVAIEDLFQLKPVMDRYIFTDLDYEYAILAGNLWQEYFKMFELTQILRQKDSKVFAEILNRLREGNHTVEDINKIKERLIQENSADDQKDVPHLFIQNAKVTQFNKIARKQFPLRPAAAKKIQRSQGDTEKKIVVNFATKRAISHIHYVGLSRVTTIDGLYVTDLCENKISVSPKVKTEMESLQKERYLQLSITPVYKLDQVSFKICFLNARSLHRHIDNVRFDLNYTSTDVNIFAETRCSRCDNDDLYKIDNYTLFRNDANQSMTTRPYGGIAVYSRIEFIPTILAKITVDNVCALKFERIFF